MLSEIQLYISFALSRFSCLCFLIFSKVSFALSTSFLYVSHLNTFNFSSYFSFISSIFFAFSSSDHVAIEVFHIASLLSVSRLTSACFCSSFAICSGVLVLDEEFHDDVVLVFHQVGFLIIS
jgi:hypothetical protein